MAPLHLAVLLVLAVSQGPSAPQEPAALQQIQQLYAAAAYEDALAATNRFSLDDVKPEVAQYRVFCLIALGRTREAEEAVEAVVTADPQFRPDKTSASPRITQLFDDARRRLIPQIAEKRYLDGRAALEKKDRPTAVVGFEQAIELLDDPDLASDTHARELRVLAAGFLDLSRALPLGPIAPEPPTVGAPPAAAPTSGRATPPVIVPPVPLHEDLPAWRPADALSMKVSFDGVVEVQISAEGLVTSAKMIDSVHSAYDPLLLNAAQSWTYRPATRDGVPVPSSRTVKVRLQPNS